MPNRKSIVEKIALHILSLKKAHPVRVCVDGITGSGKSTFAKNLSDVLEKSKRPIISTTLDGFHNPRAKRYSRGTKSPEGYYFDAYDYDSIISKLLAPLGPGGNLRFELACFDLQNDRPILSEVKATSNDSILVVDGSFSLRNTLKPFWDVSIYIQVDFNVAEDRAALRDALQFGSEEEARLTTRNRYHGAHRIHLESAKPADHANWVILNNVPEVPSVLAFRS